MRPSAGTHLKSGCGEEYYRQKHRALEIWEDKSEEDSKHVLCVHSKWWRKLSRETWKCCGRISVGLLCASNSKVQAYQWFHSPISMPFSFCIPNAQLPRCRWSCKRCALGHMKDGILCILRIKQVISSVRNQRQYAMKNLKFNRDSNL